MLTLTIRPPVRAPHLAFIRLSLFLGGCVWESVRNHGVIEFVTST